MLIFTVFLYWGIKRPRSIGRAVITSVEVNLGDTLKMIHSPGGLLAFIAVSITKSKVIRAVAILMGSGWSIFSKIFEFEFLVSFCPTS